MATIRLATSEDLPGILEIVNQAIRETAANFHVESRTLDELTTTWREAREFYPWVVAEEGERVAGFASASRYKAKAAYDWTVEVTVYTHPNHQGHGIGRSLHTRLLEILEAQGYRTIVAGIALPNPSSVRLHESLGFTHVGTLQQAGWKIGQWHDVGYWSKTFGSTSDGPAVLRTVCEVARAIG